MLNKNKAEKKKAAKSIKVKKIGGIERMQEKAFNIIIIPYLIFLFVTKGIPFVWALVISFTNYSGFNMGELEFVGLNNYTRVFTDAAAIPSITRSAWIAIIVVPISMVLCLIMSLMLYQSRKNVGIFRTIWYLPSIIPSVATVMMWKSMYDKNNGIFNIIRTMMGMNIIDWMDYDHVRSSLIIMLLWGAGGGILTNIAAMKCIPNDLYEAADIEGAGYFTKLRRITLPLISNMLYMNLVTGIMTQLQMFSQPVMLSGDSGLTATPIEPIYTYMVHVYQQIFVHMRFGYGLAMVFLIFLLIVVFTTVCEKTSKYWVYSESD